MGDIGSYRIELGDRLDEYAFNATSPHQIKVVQVNDEKAVLTICADQAGLIGLLRRLHGQGFTLLSVVRE